MPNRGRQPSIKAIERLNLPYTETVRLANGIPMYVMPMNKHGVLKLELVFRAGRPYEHKKLAARATNVLLKEGSSQYNNLQIAEELDFYGSTLSTPYNIDVSTLSLSTASKHLPKILPILEDILLHPIFPKQELHAFITNNQQRLSVELSKSDTIAYRQITEQIFGSNHPYGYNSNAAIYQALNQEDIFHHFNSCYNSSQAMIFLSGQIDKDIIKLVDDTFSRAIKKGPPRAAYLPNVETSPQKTSIHLKNSVQTAIRMGTRLFNRQHEDYAGVYLLNMILGGYFGSRLMTNIREEQGYTYNIYSTLDSMRFDGGFYIATEVSNEVVQDAIIQINKEIDLLQQELISYEEMEMVKNYTLGYLLTLTDGIFNAAELVKQIYIDELTLDFFDQMATKIRAINREEIQSIAQKYLDINTFWEVLAGPKNI